MPALEQRYPQKRVLITGATSGFGRALACLLAARGWSVAVSGIEEAAIATTCAEVVRLGGRALGLPLDVRERAQWRAVQQQLQTAWGGIDVLVNNAGIADANPMVNMGDKAWDDMIAINLVGVIHGCRTFAPDFLARKSGYFLNVASAAGLLSLPEMANYSASKAGVVSLSETLFSEFSASAIGVTALCPGGFTSPLIANANRDGRNTEGSVAARLVQKDMDAGKHTSETVAAYAIQAMERNALYAIPQPYYHLLWTIKRMAPHRFHRLIGWLYRTKRGPFSI